MVRIILAALIAYAALFFTAGKNIDLENLAKGEQNTSRVELHKGIAYTAYTVKDIGALMANRVRIDQGCKHLLWLGNSQLHYINQYHDGDHLAPYWMRQSWKVSDCLEPLGCSLPNANIQEFLILSRYAADRIPLNLLIVELVFDDLREDSLRGDFSEILTAESIAEIRNSSKTAEVILNRFLASYESGGGKNVLAGTIQQPVERWLNDRISASWKLWAVRPQIEGNFLLALYNLRNWIFCIKPTTVRRMIHGRYELNMIALHDLLDDFNRRKIPVLLYIAPIRQDKSIPYDPAAYARWKNDVATMADAYGLHSLVNLETLVPGNNWGSYTGDDIDFMHFQGVGHRLVANALLPHVQKMLSARRPQ